MILYRYEIEYKSEDGPTTVHLREIPVIRETPKMYYVKRFYFGDAERGIKKDAYNTFAYSTKEEAKKHFIRRNHKRISWYEYWIEECKKAIELIEGDDYVE